MRKWPWLLPLVVFAGCGSTGVPKTVTVTTTRKPPAHELTPTAGAPSSKELEAELEPSHERGACDVERSDGGVWATFEGAGSSICRAVARGAGKQGQFWHVDHGTPQNGHVECELRDGQVYAAVYWSGSFSEEAAVGICARLQGQGWEEQKE